MNPEKNYGYINGPVFGYVLKEMMRRSTGAIKAQIATFEAKAKENDYKADDVLTSADLAAQEEIVKMITESFPDAGIIAEENGLQFEPKNGCDLTFTIDPLDGTKAFVRKQSDGIGSMVGVIEGSQIIGSCIGDIMTGEIYYYRPGSIKVHRLHPDRHEILSYKNPDKLRLLLTDHPKLYSEKIQQRCEPGTGIFRSIDISAGSIGLLFAKMRKGEVHAIALKQVMSHPRDVVPIMGMSQQLGFVLMDVESGTVTACSEAWARESRLQNECIIVHESIVEKLK